MGTLYDTDIIAWSLQQAELLRAGRWQELDLDNIVEEIEDVGKSEQRELEGRFTVLITHLLKWLYQPRFRSQGWQGTIDTQRYRIARRLEKTPSLRHQLESDEWLSEMWRYGVSAAEDETGLGLFPAAPVWSIREMLDPAFFPEDSA